MEPYAESPERQIDRDASNLAACVQGLLLAKPAAYQTMAETLSTSMHDFSSLEFDAVGESHHLTTHFERDHPWAVFSPRFESLSHGEKCMLVGALVTATMKHERQGFVFWDEPDNHLVRLKRGLAVLGLRKIAENSGRAGYGDHQVMMASHHPETVRRFSSDNTFVLRRETHLDGTSVTRLSDIEVLGDVTTALLRGEVLSSDA